jgi:hypothetical protein
MSSVPGVLCSTLSFQWPNALKNIFDFDQKLKNHRQIDYVQKKLFLHFNVIKFVSDLQQVIFKFLIKIENVLHLPPIKKMLDRKLLNLF